MALGDVLRALADLAPGDREPEDIVDVAAGDHPFLWLGLTADPGAVFWDSGALPGQLSGLPPPMVVKRTSAARRLAGYDALHREQRLLRCGWIFLCGRVEVGGRPRRLCTPVVVRPVWSRDNPLGIRLQGQGEVQVLGGHTGWIPSYDFAYGSEPAPQLLARFPKLRRWINERAVAAGLPRVTELLGPDVRPEEAKQRADLVAVLGCALYVDRAAAPTPRASALREWAGVEDIDRTALAHLYGVSTELRRPDADD